MVRVNTTQICRNWCSWKPACEFVELLYAIIPDIILFLHGIEQFSHEFQLAAGSPTKHSLVSSLFK